MGFCRHPSWFVILAKAGIHPRHGMQCLYNHVLKIPLTPGNRIKVRVRLVAGAGLKPAVWMVGLETRSYIRN